MTGTATGPGVRPDEQRPDEQWAVDEACYVYGIVDAEASLPEELPAVAGRDRVGLVAHRGIAAVVSRLDPDDTHLGARRDLLAHDQVLAAIVADTAVLPVRFGAVLAGHEGVVDELLAPHHDHFASVLAGLEGLVQFSVRGRYDQDVVLREIVSENAEVARLRERLQALPADAGYEQRFRMGELVANALEGKRLQDRETLRDGAAPYVRSWSASESGGEDGAVDVAFLVARERATPFDAAMEELARQWSGRIRLRLLGPLAPYDFVPEV